MNQSEFETADEAFNEVLRLRAALENIVKAQPATEGGGCFYPMHDGEGNYIGEQNVDPLSVIQSMAQIAGEALCPNKAVMPSPPE